MADEAFARQEYAAAGALYSKIVQKKREKSPLQVLGNLARCCSELSLFEESGFWYKHMLDRAGCPSVVFALYGQALKGQEKYEEAKKEIVKFNSSKADSMAWKQMLLDGCDSAIRWKTLRADMAMENIKELSSPGADWVSGVTRQGLLLVSNGYRKMSMNAAPERNPAIDARTNQPYFKAYLFKQYTHGVANTYVEEILPQLLGQVPYNIGPVCYNAAEDTVYVTLNVWQQDISDIKKRGPVNGKRLMNLFWSTRVADDWTPLQPVRELNRAGSMTGHAALSRDGNTMYFMSDRKGGQGETDIWYSVKQKNGRWGAPKNCGPFINTPYEEAFPTVNENDKLYFSSKGHPGMGGFDIFRATGSGNEWTLLQNLRSPFNSGSDDLGFIMKANMYEGYFASNRPGGGGSDDVYRFMDTHFSDRFDVNPSVQENTYAKAGTQQVPPSTVVVTKPVKEPAPVAAARPVPVAAAAPAPVTAPKPAPVVAAAPAPVVTATPAPAVNKPDPVTPVVAANKPAPVAVKEPVKTPAPTPVEKPAEPAPVVTPTATPAPVAAAAPAPVVKEAPPVVATSRRPGRTAQPDTVAKAAPEPAPAPVAVAETPPAKPLDDVDKAIINKLEKLQFHYDFNSAILTTESRELLDRIAVVLKQFPEWKLMVRSYTDSRGSDAYNKDLSALRCYAVIDYLIKKGIPSNKLYYENMGYKDPVNPCGPGVPCTEAQHQANRRTMMKIIY